MHYEVALVPVLAGYWLITHTNLFSHPYGSKTYHRVFFDPAVAGIITRSSFLSTRHTNQIGPRVVLLVDKIISISDFRLEAEDIQWNVP